MNKAKRIFALLIAALLVSAFCACGKAAEPASSAPASSAPESGPDFWVDPSYTVDAEGELPEVPEDFMRKAMEAYSWFELNLLGWIYDIPAEHTENAYLVENEEFRRYDDFRDYLLGIFSPAIVNELLSRGYYVVEDGYLYTRHFPRSADKAVVDTVFGEGEIVGRKLIYKVDVTFGDMQTLEPIRSETFTFVAEPVNGRFVFTEFPYFY